MRVKLLTEHHMEFLSLKGGCIGSSESTLVKMPHCWKSHVAAQICMLHRLSAATVWISTKLHGSHQYEKVDGHIASMLCSDDFSWELWPFDKILY